MKHWQSSRSRKNDSWARHQLVATNICLERSDVPRINPSLKTMMIGDRGELRSRELKRPYRQARERDYGDSS